MSESGKACINCGRIVGANSVGYTTPHGYMCMQCEYTFVEVIEISVDGSNPLVIKFGDDVDDILSGMLDSMETGDEIQIRKSKLPPLVFFNLPEHQGF